MAAVRQKFHLARCSNLPSHLSSRQGVEDSLEGVCAFEPCGVDGCSHICLSLGGPHGSIAVGDFSLDHTERWLGKFEQRAKWNFCLTAAMVAADQERR